MSQKQWKPTHSYSVENQFAKNLQSLPGRSHLPSPLRTAIKRAWRPECIELAIEYTPDPDGHTGHAVRAVLYNMGGTEEAPGRQIQDIFEAVITAEKMLAFFKPADATIQKLIAADRRVEEVFSEQGNMDPDRDDWWVHLHTGFQCDPETHLIHEQTLADCFIELQRVRPCDCEGCIKSLGHTAPKTAAVAAKE